MSPAVNKRIAMVLVAFGGLALVVAACVTEEQQQQPSQACVPGDVDTCPCPGGGEGVQTCADDGSRYGSCEGCGSGGGSGGGGSGQGGAGQGGSSSGSGGATGAGGPTGGSGGVVQGGGGSGGTLSVVPCVDLDALSPTVDFPACDVADQAACVCEGCDNDDICFDDGLHLADDCICPDCANDKWCANPDNCVDDGLCDPYYEGCVCADCAAHPQCA